MGGRGLNANRKDNHTMTWKMRALLWAGGLTVCAVLMFGFNIAIDLDTFFAIIERLSQ